MPDCRARGAVSQMRDCRTLTLMCSTIWACDCRWWTYLGERRLRTNIEWWCDADDIRTILEGSVQEYRYVLRDFLLLALLNSNFQLYIIVDWCVIYHRFDSSVPVGFVIWRKFYLHSLKERKSRHMIRVYENVPTWKSFRKKRKMRCIIVIIIVGEEVNFTSRWTDFEGNSDSTIDVLVFVFLQV